VIFFTVLQLRFWVCALAGGVAAISYFLIAWLSIGQTGWSLPGLSQALTVPQHHIAKSLLLLICGLVGGVVARQLKQQFEHAARVTFDRDRVVNLFGRHVSPQVVDQLLQQSVRVEGEVRAVTVMFLDIRGFTQFSESRSAEEVMRYLNALFVDMIEVVNENNGLVNKFLGDGFLAVFGAPMSTGEDRCHGVAAALALLKCVERLNATGLIEPTRIGIGLHAGTAVTGNVGSSIRQEYTIIGNVVNLASRVESLNKTYGSQLLMTETVYQAAAALLPNAKDLGEVEIRGQKEKVRLYQGA
jgi:adenylate cyclase